MPRISALDRLALPTSSPVPTAAAGAGVGSGMTAGTNKPAQPNTLNIAGIASAAQAQTQAQAKDAAAAEQGDGADQTSMSVPKSIKIRRDNRPPPTTLFHRAYSFNGDIKILGSRGKDDDEEKEKEKEKEEDEDEEDEPVVKKGRGFVEKQEDVVMFEPPKESGRGTAVRPSGAGGQGVWRVGMARGMFGPRGAARR